MADTTTGIGVTRSERLHPEVRHLLESLDALGATPVETLDPAEARKDRHAGMKAFGGDPIPLKRVEDLRIPGPSGDIPARLYSLDPGGPVPALVYFHGGGFVFGNLDTHDSLCRALARQSGAIVIAVDYRLSPEHKFPVAVEDACAATAWVAANSERLGIDPSRIGAGGDSAGGCLATVVARRCRDAGISLAFQLLVYPIADLTSFETPSYLEFSEGYFLRRSAMQWFAGHYLGSPEHASHPDASPILASDLSGLPPALVITAEFDPLRDEGEAYARRMQSSGVPVILSRAPGTIHGFFAMSGVLSGGRDAIAQAAGFIRAVAQPQP